MAYNEKTFTTRQIWNTMITACVTSCILLILLIPHGALADYSCVCSRHPSRTVYSKSSTISIPLGYLYQGECKEFIHKSGSNWASVAFSHNVGYVKLDYLTVVSSCTGDPSVNDRVTTSTFRTAATSIGQFSTTVAPTGTPVSTQSQRSTTVTASTVRTIATTIGQPSTTVVPTGTPVSTQSQRSTAAIATGFQTSSPTVLPAWSTQSQISTPSPTTSTIPAPAINSTTPKLAISTTLKQPQLAIDRTNLCPAHVKDHSKKHGTALGQYGGKCFELTTREVYNWGQGETLCREGQGHLASIESRAEQDYVRELIHNNNHYSFTWIGLNDIQQEGIYRWSSGARSTYTNLHHYSSEIFSHYVEDCVMFFSESGDWHMRACLEVHPVLCQFRIAQNGGIIG